MSPQEISGYVGHDSDLVLLDVREPDEREFASIQPSEWIPMNEIPSRLVELEPFLQKKLVVYCHHGGRSARVVNFLKDQGFESVYNLDGGIDRWSLEIDPEVPRY
ncbi:MAG: hypothetical protein LR011_02235 [Verrucomicrobia bacterium]|nr:hypothetical protein [Verrucomicrobiota bacterium]